MRIIKSLYNGISSVSEWSGKTASWLTVIIIAVVSYDVFMRYIMNKPTSWGWCMSYMIGAVLYALGFSYNWLHDGNTRIDICYQVFSPKLKLIVNTVGGLLFCIPIVFILMILIGGDALFAYNVGQVDDMSYWQPQTWPYKAGVAIGFALLSAQTIATVLKDIVKLIKGGKEPW